MCEEVRATSGSRDAPVRSHHRQNRIEAYNQIPPLDHESFDREQSPRRGVEFRMFAATLRAAERLFDAPGGVVAAVAPSGGPFDCRELPPPQRLMVMRSAVEVRFP
mgnify:CR=1 FL=1